MVTLFSKQNIVAMVSRLWIACLAIVGIASHLSAQQSAIISRQWIYETAPFPECHASTIVINADGELVCSWFGGTEEGNKDVAIWLSHRTKAGWESPKMVADGVVDGKRYPCWNPVLFQWEKKLLLFYKVGPSPSTWWGMLKQSEDGGKSWSEGSRLPDGILGPIKNKPLLLANGSLLCGSSSEDDGWRTHVELVSRELKEWRKVGPLNDKGPLESIQPTFLQLQNGDLQMLCRSRSAQKIISSISKDQGATWSAMSTTELPNPNSGIDAVTLGDGRHLLVYNHTIRDPKKPGAARAQLNLAISDDGTKWKAVAQLENEPTGEFSYPAVILGEDGLVYVSYTWNRQKIRFVTLQSKQIVGELMSEGKWPVSAAVNLPR
jgi:predicted neuraminidase